MIKRYITWVSWVLTLLVIPYEAFPVDNEPFRESVVIFNTICAKCHEAQCSGRVIFGEAYEASSRHIIRHYSKASGKEWLQRELFNILNYMKKKCAYYPMSVPIPPKRIWNSEMLEKMTTLLERKYFIPIGHFTPGNYHFELSLAKDEKVTVHLVSERFDMLVDDCFLSSKNRIVIPVTIEDAGNYYVRVYPRNPVQITHLAIIAVSP
ncbi:MAG: hypothetical protein GQ470_05165 [Gammaproteobacteria bacterium]|nr:hypothetical protein [Gammaproteobacteria bacterium]